MLIYIRRVSVPARLCGKLVFFTILFPEGGMVNTPARLKVMSSWCDVLVYMGRVSASQLDCEIQTSGVLC